MERIDIDDVASRDAGGAVDRRGLTEPLGTTDVAINRYRLDPGGRISGLHAHADQEEVFLVVDGEVTFETLARRAGDDRASDRAAEVRSVIVGAGEAIRFAPGEFQSGSNDAGREAAVYALGAPRDSDDVRVPLACPECGHGDLRPTVGDGGETPVLACPACGDESPAECPECGSENVRALLPAERDAPVGVCEACGAESRP